MDQPDLAPPAAPAPGGFGATVKVFVLCGAMAAATVVLLFWGPLAGLGTLHPVGSKPLALAVLIALFVAVNLAPLSVRWGGQVTLVVLSEIPLLLGLAIVAPWALVATRLAADAFVFGLVRHQSAPKLAYNMTSGAIAAASAATVYRVMLGSDSAIGVYGWLAGAAALTAASALSYLGIRVVTRLYGRSQSHNLASEAVSSTLVLLASICLAFVVLDAAWADPWGILPLILVGGLVVFAYRGYLRLTDRFGALEQLYDFTRSVGSAKLESASTCWAILEQVQTLMRTRRAELVVVDETAGVSRFVLDGDRRSMPEGGPLSENSVVADVVRRRESFLYSSGPYRRTESSSIDDYLGEFHDALVVPLQITERAVGALVALDRPDGSKNFDEDDKRLLEAMAGQAGTTLERARLIEELRFEAEAKSYQATHDPLTGLANRTLFLERAASSLAESGRAAIALLDLDRFKDVNDSLGHGTGDQLICQVARCLVEAAGGRATVARLGGDEFAIVIPGITGPEEAVGVVRDLEAALSTPLEVEGITLAVTASAGISISPEHGNDVATLLQHADIAMYSAKARHTGIELFSAAEDRIKYRLLLGGQLAASLTAGDHLSVMYQPKASFETGEVTGVEALARWHHPEYGPARADEFISLAEQMGLVCQIRDCVLDMACHHIAQLRREGMQVKLAVNLSGRDLSDPSLISNVEQRLAESGLPPQALTLEITETELMSDINEARIVLAELVQLGVHIAVDDYGTGYSSLAYLHRLPLDELKLDRSYVSNVAHDEGDAIIVRSSITMAHSLGLSVVAEGAEDELTCSILANAGCDYVQGYFLARPMSANDLRTWLATDPRLQYAGLPVAQSLRVIPSRDRATA
jgi:diguanylate cyclase (GGDEF)-like protein